MQICTRNLIVTGNREEIHRLVITNFLSESPGSGRGEFRSVYCYYVEVLSDARKVVLHRPARLNKGMDFEVHVENTNFGITRRTSMPSHNAIIEDLRAKKNEDLNEYTHLLRLIERLYNCESISDEEIQELNFHSGHSVELILKVIKWLFIEQDVTYWNWSGRNMLYSGINAI